MQDAMNTVIQALIWTTMAGLLYAVWLRSQTASSRYKFVLSFYWQQVVQVLQWMWMLLAIGLIISLLVFAWPKSSQAAASPAPNCIAATSATADTPSDLVCGNASNLQR